MGSAVIASSIGLLLEVLCERYQARGKEKTNNSSVVMPASLKESKNGAKSKSNITVPCTQIFSKQILLYHSI